LSNEQLVYEYQQGDRKALDVIIEQNMGLVYKVANRYTIYGSPSIDIEDLEQEGVSGLIIACNKYEQDKGAAFGSYAFMWIRQGISRFITQRNTNGETSLDTPIGEDEGTTLGDMIEDESDHIGASMLRIELDDVMDRYLLDDERSTLKLRYGWDKPELTREEVALYKGEDLNRVRSTETRAKTKLRGSPWGREENYYRKLTISERYR